MTEIKPIIYFSLYICFTDSLCLVLSLTLALDVPGLDCQSRDWCVIDTSHFFLPLRRVRVLGCLEERERGKKRMEGGREGGQKEGCDNKPFESPSEGTTRSPTHRGMDRWR